MPVVKPDGTVIKKGPELRVLPKTDGKRRTNDWLAAFLDHTAELESPTNYLRWAGLSTIAAVAQRKIFRDTQAYTVYPNMYVWLVGPAGTKKSTAIRAGRRLLEPAGVPLPSVHLSSDAPSVVGIMKDFQDIAVVQKDHQTLNAFMWELSTLFENASETMTGFLTAIYDGDANYSKRTRIGDKESIPFPLLNLIAGTTPRWLGDNLSKNAVEGGLIARTIPVYSDEQSFESPEPERSKDFIRREEMLTHDLAHILALSGQFEWGGGRVAHGNKPCADTVGGCGCGDAYRWYDTWYRDRSRMPRIPDSRTQGYYVRKPMHLLKVATILSLAKRDTKTWEIDDLIAALALLDSIESGMRKAFSAVGTNPYATDLERIVHQIKSAGRISKAELAAANYHNLEEQKFEATLRSIETLGYAKKVITTGGTAYEAIEV